jgi:hypothetical protein
MKLAQLVSCLVLGLTAVTAHATPTNGVGFIEQVIQPAHAAVFSRLGYQAGEKVAIDVTAKAGNIDCILFNHRGKIVSKDESPANACHITIAKTERPDIYTLMVTNIDAETAAAVEIVVQ